MKVYILFTGSSWEPWSIRAVYATEEAALKAVNEFTCDSDRAREGEWVQITGRTPWPIWENKTEQLLSLRTYEVKE